MAIETRTDIEKLLCEQLELLAKKSRECDVTDLPAFSTAMLNVGDYLISRDFDMDTKFEGGESAQTPKSNGWSFDGRIKLQ